MTKINNIKNFNLIKYIVVIGFFILVLGGISFMLLNTTNDQETARRRAIQNQFSDLAIDFEKQPCFAGCSVKSVKNENIYYYAFILHGGGLPIAQAWCVGINENLNVTKIGEFPDYSDSYAGYRDINPINCRGIK